MRRFGFFSLLCLVLAAGLFSSEAMALGFGVYGVAGKGEADWDEDFTGSEISTDIDRYGGGFVLELGSSARNLLNYRVSLGYEKANHAINGIEVVKADAVVMTHDFGIALIRTQDIKLWFGPELYLSYAKGSPEGVPDIDIEMLGVGGGPVLGLDLNHPDTPLNISFKGSYIFTRHDTTAEFGALSTDFTIEEEEFFFTLAFIFRLGE